MKTKDKILFFAIISLIIGLIIYQVKDVLLPFILAIIISYFLNPLVNVIGKKFKISRNLTVILIVKIFIVFLIIFFSIVLPILYSQSLNFIDSVPEYIQFFSDNFYPNIVDFLLKFNIEIENDFFELIKSNKFFIVNENFADKLISNVITSTNFIINLLSIFFIMPILVFYLLKDWNSLINKTSYLIPEKYSQQIIQIFKQIDEAIANYLRGQTNVCIILALYYSIMLAIAGLNHGIFIGIATGILSFVPFIGYGIGISIAIIVSLFQWGLKFDSLMIILAIYLLGQIIESYFLVPHLIGGKIKIHPLGMIFGIFFFGALLGVFGVLLSVPLTAISMVLIRYIMKNSRKT
ncbi:MAG: AI-2E family transporter [Alphaproteobacteria bacterium]